MSSGPRIPLGVAERWARRLVATLHPHCARIEIAGSIRRRKPDVGDIEVVCQPLVETVYEPTGDLFEPTRRVQRLPLVEEVQRLVREGVLGPPIKAGDRYRQHPVPSLGVALDLFLVRPPAQWASILAIRTGPAAFSERLVTVARDNGYHFQGGALRNELGIVVPAPDERVLFGLCGVPWLEPEER